MAGPLRQEALVDSRRRRINPSSQMWKPAFLAIVAVLLVSGAALLAEPPAKNELSSGSSNTRNATTRKPLRAQIIESANGWTYVKSEWVHPQGYKFVNNKVLRTTAEPGKAFPKPPGKLALENPAELSPSIRLSPTSPSRDDKTAAEKAAEARRKNLEPRPASQTGTHL